MNMNILLIFVCSVFNCDGLKGTLWIFHLDKQIIFIFTVSQCVSLRLNSFVECITIPILVFKQLQLRIVYIYVCYLAVSIFKAIVATLLPPTFVGGIACNQQQNVCPCVSSCRQNKTGRHFKRTFLKGILETKVTSNTKHRI